MVRARAFTLIELLTVLVVLGLLAGLVLPSLSSARSTVRRAVCLGNLTQWGIATALYSAENHDLLPPEGSPNPTAFSTNTGWYVQLPRQLGIAAYHDMRWRTNAAIDPGRSLWICPANSRRSNGRNLFHYCLNDHVNGTGRESRATKLSSISHPESVPWLFDSKNLPAVGSWSFMHTNLHNQGAQILFLDGHARRFHNSEYWDFRSNKGRTNNPQILWIP